MGREDPQLKLRLTEEMKDRITAVAKENGRSVNAEIVARLDKSFIGDFIPIDDLTGIKTVVDEMAQTSRTLADELVASAKRERELNEKFQSLLNAFSESQAMTDRLLAMVEAKQGVSS